jgi:hypothetical protein
VLRLRSLAVLGVLVLGGAARAASLPSEQQAIATVTELARGNAHACRVSVDGLTAEPIGDPIVSTAVTGWRVTARVRPFGEVRLRTTADWIVDAKGATPDSPLAGRLAAACKADPGPPGTPEAWHSLPYLDAGGDLYLTGNERWPGAVSTVPTGSSDLSLASYPWGERYRFVWGATCMTGKQTVRLHRTVYAPGVPVDASISLASLALRPGSAATNPVRSLRLLVNGREAFVVHGSGAPPAMLPEDALRLFRYGANDVVLEAQKRPSRTCNHGPSSLQVGIAFELVAHFRSTLGTPGDGDFVVPGFHRAGTSWYARVPRTGERTGSLQFTIRNGGPSGDPGATFRLDLDGTARIAIVGRTLSRNVVRCETADATAAFDRTPPYHLVCSLVDLEAGVPLQLGLKLQFLARSGFRQKPLQLTWQIESPLTETSSRTATLVFCSRQATEPGCVHAS